MRRMLNVGDCMAERRRLELPRHYSSQIVPKTSVTSEHVEPGREFYSSRIKLFLSREPDPDRSWLGKVLSKPECDDKRPMMLRFAV
jgi:hypothetical protein